MMRRFNVNMYDHKQCVLQGAQGGAQDGAQGAQGGAQGDDHEEDEVGQEMMEVLRDVEQMFGEAVSPSLSFSKSAKNLLLYSCSLTITRVSFIS